MKALILNGKVQQTAETDFPVSRSLEWVDIPGGLTVGYGYLWDGASFSTPPAPPAPEPTLKEQVDDLKQQVTDLLSVSVGTMTKDELDKKYSGKLTQVKSE